MVNAEIADYYARGLERDRLTAGRARVEFIRMWRCCSGACRLRP